MKTPNLELVEVSETSTPESGLLNESFWALDVLVQPSVQSVVLNAPPADAKQGAKYIVALPATGEWSGHDRHVAYLTPFGWKFRVPRRGWRFKDLTSGDFYEFSGVIWEAVEEGGGGGGGGALTYVGGATVTGAAATSLSISGLSLDADEEYVIRVETSNSTGSSGDIGFFFNADTTATNYDTQLYLGVNATNFAARSNNAQIIGHDANTSSSAEITVRRQIGGRVVVMAHSTRNEGANIVLMLAHMTWRTASINVVGITLTATVSDSIAVGSYIKVWKRQAS